MYSYYRKNKLDATLAVLFIIFRFIFYQYIVVFRFKTVIYVFLL